MPTYEPGSWRSVVARWARVGEPLEAPRRGTLRPGSVLARAIGSWVEGFATFGVLSAVASLPVLVYAGWVMADDGRLLDREASWAGVLTLGSWLSWALATAGVTHAVVERLGGRSPSLWASLRAAVVRLVPLLFTVVTLFLYLLAPIMFVTVLPMLLTGLGWFRGEWAGVALLLVAFGTTGVVLVVHAVAVPVAVVETGPPQAVLARSRVLTGGDRWRILAVLLVLAAVAVAAHLLVSLALPRPDSPGDVRAHMAVGLALQVLGTTPLLAIATALVYHDLRAAKEGVSAGDLARVFE